MNENEESNVMIVYEIIKEYKNRTIVDNDFEHAYNIPFDAFDHVHSRDMIEALFVLQATIDEMNATNALGVASDYR